MGATIGLNLWAFLIAVTFISLIIALFRIELDKEREKKRMLIGTSKEKLKVGNTYRKCPFPEEAVFLLKDGEITPKLHILWTVNTEKLPPAFMVIEDGKIVSLDLIDIYEGKSLASELDDLQGEIIELKGPADKQPKPE